MLNWTQSISYISPGTGRIVKITITKEAEENEDTSVFTPKIKQEFQS